MADGCLLLLARADDPAIRTLQQQAPHRVMHGSIVDLSHAGWRYVTGRPDQASAYAGGCVIPADQIAAVLCRIRAIGPTDLLHAHRDDRAYVAAELNAFLRAWLTQFRGMRFNEPTWTSLAGPGWHALQWTWLVANIGVPVAPPSLLSGDGPGSDRETLTATVVRDEVLGVTEPTLIDYSLRIARGVHSNLLAVTFVRDRIWKFLSADACPALDAGSAAALLRRVFEASALATTPHVGASCAVA